MGWNMEYTTRGEYMNALEQALEGRDIPDANKMLTDIKNYFFKRNLQSVGDTEIISTLPDPFALAEQYDGKTYSDKRALKKNGSAGIVKRFFIGILTIFATILGVVFFISFLASLVGGIASIVMGVLYFVSGDGIAGVVNSYTGVDMNTVFANRFVGVANLISSGLFAFLLSVTALKALWRLRKKYHTWTLKKISGCFRLPVSVDDVYSKGWRILVYIFLPLSLIVSVLTLAMTIFGVSFTF
ncbi:MAG: DUF1700 domain-containing protein [Peptococcaceae bacterium]|nr:DUF1700 domain-containing protein [Peptococcaceae bacterium]